MWISTPFSTRCPGIRPSSSSTLPTPQRICIRYKYWLGSFPVFDYSQRFISIDWEIVRRADRLCRRRHGARQFEQGVRQPDVVLFQPERPSRTSCPEHHQSIRLPSSSRTGQSAGQGLCLRCRIRFVSQHLSRRKFLNWESSHQLIDVYRFTRKRRPNGRRTKGSTAWQPTESCYFSQKENSKEAQRRPVAGSKSLWEEPCTIWGTRDQHLKRNPKYFLP